MEIKQIKIADIRISEYNPRKDLQPGDPEYQAIERSIAEFGMLEPLIWNQKTGNLVGGHQRLKILKDRGASNGDTIAVSVVDLEPPAERALNLALNRASGAWDEEKLVAVLQELTESGYDRDITGFSEREIDALLEQFTALDFDGEGDAAGQEIGPEHRCPKCGFEF